VSNKNPPNAPDFSSFATNPSVFPLLLLFLKIPPPLCRMFNRRHYVLYAMKSVFYPFFHKTRPDCHLLLNALIDNGFDRFYLREILHVK